MTAPTLIDGLAPRVEPEVAATTSVLARRFPGAVVWYGAYTRRWWAMVRVADRMQLFEGAGPDEITGAIINRLR
jgi:hypothetical protein